MSDDIVIRLERQHWCDEDDCNIALIAADEIERLRELAKALYDETTRCGSKHDVKATNDWEEYDEAIHNE